MTGTKLSSLAPNSWGKKKKNIHFKIIRSKLGVAYAGSIYFPLAKTYKETQKCKEFRGM